MLDRSQKWCREWWCAAYPLRASFIGGDPAKLVMYRRTNISRTRQPFSRHRAVFLIIYAVQLGPDEKSRFAPSKFDKQGVVANEPHPNSQIPDVFSSHRVEARLQLINLIVGKVAARQQAE